MKFCRVFILEKRKIHLNAFDTLFSIILTIVCDLFKHEKPSFSSTTLNL